MKAVSIIVTIAALSFLTGCYTTIGVVEEEQTDYANRFENEADEQVQGYFDEEMENDYYEEIEIEKDDTYYEENKIDFFTIFSGAVSDFFSTGAFNVIIDLSSSSSNNSTDSNYGDNTSRNNSGSRNYDGR